MINSVTSIPRPEGVELLMFADDLKIFGVVSSEDDYMGIQTFLDSLQGWCLANCLHLNPAKCTAASFSRSSRLLSFPYRIGGGVLDRPASIRDLGVFMDAKLTFSHHIDAIVSKALRALGFLKRCTRDFTSMEAIVLLYKSLVRPILEYSSVVWSPYYQVHKERLERVQRRFLRYLNFKMHIPLEELDIVELAARSGLQDLEVRRTMADLMFLFKLLNAEISSPVLLARISFNAPGYFTRHQHLFRADFAAFNYLQQRPLCRLPRVANALLESVDFDFFHDSRLDLRKRAIEFLGLNHGR
ncbi:Retrotransposon protein [Nesidiocoris tenuis]|uniref:Retrotransposon protein n=2 Tax=Nesidiocoris tenuis TaxID=355587 RepID=A0ABN7AJ07_9HEMI|nr:Retrotransposon protein [Nesidiocoris tenuis]